MARSLPLCYENVRSLNNAAFKFEYTIDDVKLNALTAHVELATHHDDHGMPAMGSVRCGIQVMIDLHDTENVTFAKLAKLYELSGIATRDKIKDMKIEYWTDDSQTDAICTYSFRGWISLFSTSSGAGTNHTLRLSLQPALDTKQFIDIKLGN